MLGVFIKVHPFINGNGRVSRLVANYLCYRHNLPMPFVDPSNRPPDTQYWQSMSLAMQGSKTMLWQYLFAAVSARAADTASMNDEQRSLLA
jgi:Fic family protein